MDENTKRILIIDDTPEDHEVYRRFLGQSVDYRFDLRQAQTGQEGLELVRDEAFDCLLLDYQLPDMDGLEILTELSGERGSPTIPVIFLTGHGDEMVAVQAMKRGASDYLVKGKLTGDLLLRSVHQAIEEVESRGRVENLNTLRGLVPICSKCKNVRGDEGRWEQVEEYFESHANVLFSHSCCPNCLEDLYGNEPWYNKTKNREN
jgi:CheY-like chemotaxis protein